MTDAILFSLVKLSEQESPFKQEITLILGGFLVSGVVISYQTYIKQNHVAKNIERLLTAGQDAETLKFDEAEDSFNFLHLRDAKCFAGGNNPPTPTNTGLTLRIPLNSIHGYSLSSLTFNK